MKSDFELWHGRLIYF